MEELAIEGTLKTPTVISDSNQGLLEIKGRSNPENTVEVFKPIVNWVEEYVQNPGERTTINIQLEHFNTSSSKSILELFRAMNPIHLSDKDIVVNWFYEGDDEDIMEAGENYQAITGLPFRMVEL